MLKSDVTVAKNYLSEAEMSQLNTLVSAYLDLAENRAQRGLVTRMSEWSGLLNRFLELSEYPVLADKGKVSALAAKLKAETEFETYRRQQDADYVSDFDRVLAETRKLGASAASAAPGKGRGGKKR